MHQAQDQHTPVPTRRSLLDSRLRLQLRLFLLLCVVMLVLSIWHVAQDGVSPLWLLAGLLPGFGLGVLLSRTKVLGWDADQRSVVGRSDALGIAILVLYLIFVLVLRDDLVGRWTHNAAATSVVSLAMTAATMLSRVVITMRGVRDVLRAAGISLPTRD